MNCIPKNPRQAQKAGPGDWISIPGDREGAQICQIVEVTERRTTVDIYRVDESTSELQKVEERPIGPDVDFSQAIRVRCQLKDRTIEFNPKYPIPEEARIWLPNPHKINELQWDPGEWLWAPTDGKSATSILNYVTKTGYRIGLQNRIKQTKYDKTLSNRGLTIRERRNVYERL